MNRVRPTEVVEAFNKNNSGIPLIPMRSGFAEQVGDSLRCCGLSAVWLHEVEESYLYDFNLIRGEWFVRDLDLTAEYTRGFMDGWDNNPESSAEDEYRQGYKDGANAYQAVTLTRGA